MSSIEKAVEKLKKSVKPSERREPRIEQFEKTHQNDSVTDSTTTSKTDSQEPSQQEVYPILSTLEAQNMVTPSLNDTRQAEEYRQIKRPLLSNISGRRASTIDQGNVIMVTSALPGEGKTYTTINLAMSIATERDRSVLLVDCDVIKRSLSSLFGLQEHPGLIDFLDGSVAGLRDVIVSTDVPSLKILPAGHTDSYSTELLASDEMGRVMDEMAARYPDRIIIFDSPPLLMTSQSVVLTNHAGQILVVVEEGVTSQKAVLDAISKLDQNKVIGTVLNKRSRLSPGEQYGGYYGSYGD